MTTTWAYKRAFQPFTSFKVKPSGVLFLTGVLAACTPQAYAPYGSLLPFDELAAAVEILRALFALAGLALLLAGWKIYRFVVALPGLLIGAALGGALGYYPNENALMAVIGLALGGAIGALLAIFLHDLMIFALGALGGGLVLSALWAYAADGFPPALLLILSGVAGGVLLLILARLWIIGLSAAIGAAMFGGGIGAGVGWMLLFFALGAGFQLGLARMLGGPSAVEKPVVDKPPTRPEPAPAAPSKSSLEPLVLSAVLIHPNGQQTPILADNFLIGRGSACDLRIMDRRVSRQHACIRYAQGAWFLQDVESAGGTFVNGGQVMATRLGQGDRIKIGETTLVFQAGGQPV